MRETGHDELASKLIRKWTMHGLASFTCLAWLTLAALGAAPPERQDAAQRPTFRAGTDVVALSAVVRKRNGQPVTDLKREDFELLDNGQRREIVDFQAAASPVTIALLADFSGSMEVADKLDAARAAAFHIISWLTPDSDQVGLFAFDSRLQQLEPIGPAPGRVLDRLKTVRPWGSTSLFDAIAETGRQLAAQGGRRRAVVALTDGGDNASRMTSTQVSGIASSIDVPVYIVVVVSEMDRVGASKSDDRATYQMLASGRLGDLARWTGGELFVAAGSANTSVAARQIVAELRHQYLIAFEPDTRPGWHPIELRARQGDLVVQTRSGYVVRYSPSLVN